MKFGTCLIVVAVVVASVGCRDRTYRVQGFRDLRAVSSTGVEVFLRTPGQSRLLTEHGRRVDVTGSPFRFVIGLTREHDIVVDEVRIRLSDSVHPEPITVRTEDTPLSPLRTRAVGESALIPLSAESHVGTVIFVLRRGSRSWADSVEFRLEPYVEERTLPFAERVRGL